MQKIEIKPNDQTYVGKTFVSGTISCVLLDVGSEYVIRSAINTSDPFDRRVVSIHDFNDCWALEEPSSTASAGTEGVNWSNVKYARHKKSGLFYHIKNGCILADRTNDINSMLDLEPIKFTQTLKVGDLIKAKNEHFQWEVKSFHPDNGFTVRLLESGHPDFIRDMDIHFVHSDDWELVNKPEEFVAEKKEMDTKQLRLAPCIFKHEKTSYWAISEKLFATKLEAEFCYGPTNQVLWPAIPDKDGFYTVPEVGE